MKIPILRNHNHYDEGQLLGYLTVIDDELIAEFDPPIDYDSLFEIFPTVGCRFLDAKYNDEILIERCKIVEFSHIG